MSNPKGAPTTRALAVFTLIAVAVVVGLAAYVKFTPADRVPSAESIRREEPRLAPKVEIENRRAESRVLVFVPRFVDGNPVFDPVERSVPAGEDARVFAVNAFLTESKVPDPEARLLSVDVHDGVATLSFNAAFEGGYGSDDEHTIIDGLRHALGQFPEIERIKIAIDGQPVESLGNVEVGEGWDVVRPSTSEPASTQPQSR